jgi:hypothetical protein
MKGAIAQRRWWRWQRGGRGQPAWHHGGSAALLARACPWRQRRRGDGGSDSAVAAVAAWQQGGGGGQRGSCGGGLHFGMAVAAWRRRPVSLAAWRQRGIISSSDAATAAVIARRWQWQRVSRAAAVGSVAAAAAGSVPVAQHWRTSAATSEIDSKVILMGHEIVKLL